jgi:hypothetical protein
MSVTSLDLFQTLKGKLGEAETKSLIEYVENQTKTTGGEVQQEWKADKQLLATKEDLYKLETALKKDIFAIETSLRRDISTLESRMEAAFKDQLKWLIILLFGFSSLIVTVIKLL